MAQAQAANIKENTLTCSICLGEYKDPRVLPCYHTFCYGCISDYAQRSLTPNQTFTCPICREETQIPAGGLNQLKKNLVFGKAKDIITQQQVDKPALEEEQANAAAVTQVIAKTTTRCGKHPNKEVKYYCEDDDTVICGQCIVTEHSGHRISSVDKVAEINRENLQGDLAKTRKTTDRFKAAVAKETANKIEDSRIREVIINEIENQAQQIVLLLNERKEILISEVNAAYDVRKKQNEANKDILELHHGSLQGACDFAQQLVTNGTDSDIMVHAKALRDRLKIMEQTHLPTPDTPAQISYSPGEIFAEGLEAMLGQVAVQPQTPLAGTYPRSPPHSPGLEAMFGQVTVQTQPPLAGQGTIPKSRPCPPVFLENAKCVNSFNAKLKDDRVMYISGVATDGEKVFVVDNGDERTKTFTHTGEFKYDIKPNRPFDVAVSQTGRLYITSWADKCVKVFSTRGQQVTTMGQEKPCGITVNRQGHVMVCDMEKKAIFTFHADSGQFMNTIPLSMCAGPMHIAVNSLNDNIVISDRDNHCVHVLSPTGNQLYQYGTRGSGVGQLREPHGVCTDSYGHIFVADFLNHRVVALSPQGQFIKYIATQSDGLKRPTALAINPGSQLVVAEQWGKVKTFQYLQ